jgi:hypothetical protein
LSRPLQALIALVGCALVSMPVRRVTAQSSFPSSLTVTISRLAPEGVKAASDSLGCRQVTLHWRARAGANRYVVYMSTTGRAPWVALPSRDACGSSEQAGPTSVTDVEPTVVASGGRRTIYYKVAALAGDSTGERTLDTTSVVSVELR